MKTYKLKIKIGENLRNLRMKLIKPRKFRPGLTLAEMLVAVGITVGLLLMTGMVFKTTTGAVGKGLAQNEICQQVRTLTRQIDTDFTGLRPDMPLAIIFEQFEHDPDLTIAGDEFLVRQDRIVFFANGDFQTLDGISGNMARIFYGQSFDNELFPYTAFPLPEEGSNAPPRRILARKSKVLVAQPLPSQWTGAVSEAEHDCVPIEFATASWWKNRLYSDYNGSTNTYFIQLDPVSIIRRPDLAAINFVRPDGMQRNYLLSDVTDFKIQFWVNDTANRGVWRWFPDEIDLINGPYIVHSNCDLGRAWNIPGAPPTPLLPSPSPQQIDLIDWYLSQPGAAQLPPALKITFTVYDQGRRQYPEGQTYSYIVKLPQP